MHHIDYSFNDNNYHGDHTHHDDHMRLTKSIFLGLFGDDDDDDEPEKEGDPGF